VHGDAVKRGRHIGGSLVCASAGATDVKVTKMLHGCPIICLGILSYFSQTIQFAEFRLGLITGFRFNEKVHLIGEFQSRIDSYLLFQRRINLKATVPSHRIFDRLCLCLSEAI